MKSQDKIHKLKQVIELLQNDTITPKEVERFLATVVQVIKDQKDQFQTISNKNLAEIDEAVKYLSNNYKEQLANIEKKATQDFNKEVKAVESKIKDVKKLVDEAIKMKPKDGEKGDDGYTPVLGKDYFTDKDKEVFKKDVVKELDLEKVIDSKIKDFPKMEDFDNLNLKLNEFSSRKIPIGLEVFKDGKNLGRFPSINFKGGDIQASASRIDVDLSKSIEWGEIGGALSDQTDLVNYIADQVATADTLQEVTDNGATTTNTITLSPTGNNEALIANGSGSGAAISITHAGSGDMINGGTFVVDNSGQTSITNTSTQLSLINNGAVKTDLFTDSSGNLSITTSGGTINLPNAQELALSATSNSNGKITGIGRAEFVNNGFFGVSGTSYISFNTSVGSIFSQPIRVNDDINLAFGNARDYTIGHHSASDTLQIVDGSTLNSNVRMQLDSSGNFVFGGTTASARLHAISTTEQLRLGYDSSNYASLTTDSSGNLDITLAGTTPTLSFTGAENGFKLIRAASVGQYIEFITDSGGNKMNITSKDMIFQTKTSGKNFIFKNSANVAVMTLIDNGTGGIVRYNYDSSNYADFSVNSSGNLTIEPTGGLTFKSNSLSTGSGIVFEREPDLATNNRYSILGVTQSLTANSPSANASFTAIEFAPRYTGSGTLNTLYGAFYSPINFSTGTVTTLIGSTVWVRNASTGTVGSIRGISVDSPQNNGTISGTVSGLYVGNQGLSGVTNSYGLFVASQSGSTNSYGVYVGGGKSYFGDSVGIGTTSPNASAILQADSTTQGFLPPRMTTTQKNAISSPATGLVVYDTTLNKLAVYTGSVWETVTSV